MNKDTEQINNVSKISEAPGKSLAGDFVGAFGFLFVLLPVVAINPMLLSKAGADFDGIYTAVVLLTSIGCIVSAWRFDRAFVMIPSTGLCAYLVYGVILSEGIPWQDAMGVVLIASILLGLVLYFGGIRLLRKVFPSSICSALMAGLGLMLVYRGLVDGGLIINSPMGGSNLGNMAEPVAYLSLLGIFVTWVLLAKGFKWAFAAGALSVIVGALSIGFIELPAAPFSLPMGLEYVVFQLDFDYMERLSLVTAGIFILMIIQTMAVYEGLGAIQNASENNNAVEKTPVSPLKISLAGAMGSLGALLGAGPVMASESGAVAEAEKLGKRGRLITGILILLLLFVGPLVRELVKLQAFYVPAMIFSGFLLFVSVYKGAFEKFPGIEGFPEILTLVMMPLTGDIISSLAFGMTAYVLQALVRGGIRRVHPASCIVVVFFLTMLFFAHGGVLPK